MDKGASQTKNNKIDFGASQDYIKEKGIKNAPKSAKINNVKKIIEQSEKCICKIKCNDKESGTGFFSLIPFPDKTNQLRTLMTNNHVLKKSDIEIGKNIKFSINNGQKTFNILIDDSRKVYTSKKYDITIIELKNEDGIKDDFCLEIDDLIFKENIKEELKEKSIYLLHYPNGAEAEYSQGTIKSIGLDNYTIEHLCDSSPGSSGSPILTLDNNKLIGIHKG